MPQSTFDSGNIPGGPRAEIDAEMLRQAFVSTHDYQALLNTRDFNFVVGRRGTGKSALYLMLEKGIESEKKDYVYSYAPHEYEQTAIISILRGLDEHYGILRVITRVAWRVAILLHVYNAIQGHFKFKSTGEYDFLVSYLRSKNGLIRRSVFSMVREIVRNVATVVDSPKQVPSIIAQEYDLERLHRSVNGALLTMHKSVVFLLDGLDEGWQPDQIATSILGGLASAAADIRDKRTEIQIVIFLRDNIFRSLSYFDRDILGISRGTQFG